MVQLKRGSYTDLSTSSVVLESGQAAYETDTHRLKIGDGLLQYGALPYVTFEGSYLPLDGGTMSGDIDMMGNAILYHTSSVIPFVAENSLSSSGVFTSVCKRDATASNEAQLILDATGKVEMRTVDTRGEFYVSVDGNQIAMNNPTVSISTQTFSLTTAGTADFNGSRLIQVGTCQKDSDAANKQYVDNEIQTVNQSLSNLQSSIKDYVTQEGTINLVVSSNVNTPGNISAYHRKWSSGRVEIWANFNVGVRWDTQLGSTYYSDFVDITLPFSVLDYTENARGYSVITGSMGKTAMITNVEIYEPYKLHFRTIRGISSEDVDTNVNIYISAQLAS